MNCSRCDKTDGLVYTSLPPKFKCTITGKFHVGTDECDVEFMPTERCNEERKSDNKMMNGVLKSDICASCIWGKEGFYNSICAHCPNCIYLKHTESRWMSEETAKTLKLIKDGEK